MIIDFHTHTFPDKIAARVIRQLEEKSLTRAYTHGTVQELADTLVHSGVDYAVNLPVMSRVDQVEHVNHSLVRQKDELARKGIITFGGMHPDDPGYKEELRYLKEAGIKGIKIHPAYQQTDLDDIRYLRIIEYASELGLIVITHAGIDIGISDHNYASVDMILRVIRQVHPDKLVLAHMGGWGGWNEVESDLAGAPVYLDTAFSLGRIPQLDPAMPSILTENMAIDDWTRLCRKHGIDKILFASDSPWADPKEYRIAIECSLLSDEEKEKILSGNARKLLAG